MVADVLVDTGVILVLLDENERWHPYCQNAFRQIRVPLLTSEAVLTEVFQLLHRSRTGMESVWTLLESGVIALAAIGHSDLPKIRALMSRYKDLPMDFADATLVYLAEWESISAIFTLDQKDSSVYRIARSRRFHILPVERP